MGAVHCLFASGLGFALLVPGAPKAMAQPLFDAPPLSDEELGEARGGFELPGGATIDFAAAIRTSVDGVRVLETHFAINHAGVSATVSAADDVKLVIPEVEFSSVPKKTEAAKISVVASDIGASPVAAPAAGASDASPADNQTVTFAGSAATVSADFPGLQIQHAVGGQFSSWLINTADNRVIATQFDISLRLSNVQPMALGSLPFQVEKLSLDAAAWRGF